MKPATLLKHARKLIDKGWCQRALARDVLGHPCDAEDESATSYCILGALYAADFSSGPVSSMCETSLNKLSAILYRENKGSYGLSGYNDTTGRTKKEILSLFDQAIEELVE